MNLQKQISLIEKNSIQHYLLKHDDVCFSILKVVFVLICVNSMTGHAFTKNINVQQVQNEIQEPNSYIETVLGDQQTPLILLKREILSSDDVLSCLEAQNIDLQNMKQESKQTLEDIALHQQTSINNREPLLLGFPITTLNKLMNITGVATHFSDQGNTFYQTPVYQNIFRGYHLANVETNVQARLISPNDGSCSLGFAMCHYQDDCVVNDEGQPIYYTEFPVLGISKNHQVIIIDPASIGNQLKEQIMEFKSQYGAPEDIPFKVKDTRSSIVGFSQSTLVFDAISTLDFLGSSPLPEMTSRWSLRFQWGKNKDDFMTKAPVEGVGYHTVHSPLYDTHIIFLRDISRDNPVHFYVKNVPDNYQAPFRESFDHWNTIFISLKGYPAFTYQFIQGNYDGQTEIITGDIRYNVLEWDMTYRHSYNGQSHNLLFDQNTGQIWSTSILIQGPRLIEEYSRWFQYSDAIRANEVIRQPLLTAPFHSDTYNLISQVSFSEFPLHHQTLMLAPEDETFDSYIPKLLKAITTHELGHPLGLMHNHKSSIFAQNGYVGNSHMEYLKPYNLHKPVSGTYDRMALAYGYLGMLPERTDLFCANSDLIDSYHNNDQRDKSPECSRTDGTSLPLEDFASRLRQTFDLLTSRKDNQSFPYLVWNTRVNQYVNSLTFGLISYYFSADTHYDQLQTVLIEGQKPENPQEVKDLVIEYLDPIICNPRLHSILQGNDLDIGNNFFDSILHQNVLNFMIATRMMIFNETSIKSLGCPMANSFK